MPKARVTGIPQIHGSLIYGEISIEVLPSGTSVGQIPYWDGIQWRLATLEGEGRIDITYDSDSSVITFVAAEDRVYDDFIADAVLKATLSGSFTGDSTLLNTASGSFTGDAFMV